MGVKLSADQLKAWTANNPHLRVSAAERPAAPKVAVPEHGEHTYALHPDSLRELREAAAAAAPAKKQRARKLPYAICATPGRSWTFTHNGPIISSNKTHAGLHWSKRKALVDKWHSIFLDLLAEAQVEPVQALKVHLRYNSRNDVDNTVFVLKLCVDSMKGTYLADDTKRYYRGLHIEADETLPHNTFIFTIQELLP